MDEAGRLVNGWTVAAFLVGWMVGTWMSWRKILADRRLAERTRGNISTTLFNALKDIDVINITITDEGEQELTIDQIRLDELLGNKDRKH